MRELRGLPSRRISDYGGWEQQIPFDKLRGRLSSSPIMLGVMGCGRDDKVKIAVSGAMAKFVVPYFRGGI
jgi:hypothetical protein